MTEELSQEFLDARKAAEELRNMYRNDAKQETFNLLLLGEMGTGKTFLARTAVFPVHVDSFDPGGTKGLREYIERGDIVVDTRYEGEDPQDPGVFKEWLEVMDQRVRDNYFAHIGTYWLDSSTSWSAAIMNDVLKKAGIPGKAPRFTKDYTPQKLAIDQSIRHCLDLPCNFVLTGHLESYNDEQAGMTRFRYMTTGKGVIIIPTLFDEIWVAQAKESSNSTEYRILTTTTETYTARSRMAADGLLDMYEAPDIKAMLKKAGFGTDDKPRLFEEES